MKIPSITATLVAVVISTSAMQAQTFDFSDPTSWDITGDVGYIGNSIFLTNATSILPGDDGVVDLNFSNTDVVDSFTLEGFAILVGGDLDPDSSNNNLAFEGSAFQRTFNVPLGEKISFKWQIFTNETAATDQLFVVLTSATEMTTFLTFFGNSSDANFAGSLGFAFQSGVNLFESGAFALGGDVTVTIGVIDAGMDGSVSSALQVNALTVPEPSALLLGLVSSIGFLLVRNRRARQA